jgi:hypothetical protein
MMNDTVTQPTPHLGDDELLRLIDDDGDAAWRAPRDQHLAGCPTCAHEIELLAGDAATVRSWLDRAAFEDAPVRGAATGPAAQPAPARQRMPDPRSNPWRSGSPWLRAAAVILLIAAPVAALPGLRGWITDIVTGEAGDATVRTMSAPATAEHTAVIRFVPDVATFAVDIDVRQADGVLTIRGGAGSEAVLTGVDDALPVVSAAALRIHNDAGSQASYALELPATVSRVVVRIDGRVVADLDAQALSTGVDVPLGDAGVSP